MAEDDILGHFPACGGQGNDLIGSIVDQPLLSQGAKGLGNGGAADLEGAGNLLGPGHLLFGDDVEDGFQIIFQAGAESFGWGHGLDSVSFVGVDQERERLAVRQIGARLISYR